MSGRKSRKIACTPHINALSLQCENKITTLSACPSSFLGGHALFKTLIFLWKKSENTEIFPLFHNRAFSRRSSNNPCPSAPSVCPNPLRNAQIHQLLCSTKTNNSYISLTLKNNSPEGAKDHRRGYHPRYFAPTTQKPCKGDRSFVPSALLLLGQI